LVGIPQLPHKLFSNGGVRRGDDEVTIFFNEHVVEDWLDRP
jgi:hypothetical protein